MRYGIISDVHGSLPALDAVMLAAEDVDGWICLGDTVGYGPNPNECVERVRACCEAVLVGNHDLAAIERLDIAWFNPFARAAAEWTMSVLTQETREFLEKLPETWIPEMWDCTFAHGSLTDPPRDYVLSRLDARRNFSLLTTQALFIGHSHVGLCFTQVEQQAAIDEDPAVLPMTIRLDPGARYIMNCGSVGQPRDGDPRASFGILDLDSRCVEVLRVEYDIPRVQQQMSDAGLPELLIRRLEEGF